MTPEVLRGLVIMVAAYLSWQVIFPVVGDWGVYIITVLAVAAFIGAAYYVFANTAQEKQYPSAVRARTKHAQRP